MESAEGQTPAIEDQIGPILDELRGEARQLESLARALAPLGKVATYGDLQKADALLTKAKAQVAEHPLPRAVDCGTRVLAVAEAELDQRRTRLRESLAKELRALTTEAGLEMKVLRREDPVHLRISPLAVVINKAKGNAELQFAHMTVAQCSAEAPAIMKAYDQALSELNTSFDAGAFFDACYRAWLSARALASGTSGERVEIAQFMPHLAFQMQSAAFMENPTSRGFKEYSRVQFAWDVLRLRRAHGLIRNGWRINLGVATGTTATKKKRVIWFEDEYGDGEFKLTVFFVREEG